MRSSRPIECGSKIALAHDGYSQVEAVIPPKANRKEQRAYDEEVYKWRHLIENLFQKLKQYRAIATRYDKRASAFLGGIYLAATVIWLN
jgi:transposase